MRTFNCACGARIFFDNSRCLSCGSELGFLPDQGVSSSLEPTPEGPFLALGGSYEKCRNYSEQGVCNWMVPAAVAHDFCQACRLNNVIPDLSNPENRELWAEVERAKRRLVYGLNRLRLSLVSKQDDPQQGLAFDIKADVETTRVLTGHDEGLITLNIAEADAVSREKMRVSMKERYRTLLGHFRHEVGHYYWDRLIRDSPWLSQVRGLFGDDTADYTQALQQYYARGNTADWPADYISAYAQAHPWEDWAETFAHYLHMVDTLDTAQHFGFTPKLPERTTLLQISDFGLLMQEWSELTVALNALNRSMGLPDAYPFATTAKVSEKLELVHRIVREQRRERAAPTPSA
ncbi:MAG TPA: putative zinc-binding metallopeptidase [Polyangiaceae bacterium]|nr:putative zinc-binding metallopeptidase [Polyangiaceae bacterium]